MYVRRVEKFSSFSEFSYNFGQGDIAGFGTMRFLSILMAALLSFAPYANALCIYKDQMYAKTTLEQEFSDSSLVVRGNIISSQNIVPSDPEAELGVRYKVRIDQIYKGKSPTIFDYYSERNSGGFYPGVGKKFLLFLNPASSTVITEESAGTMVINYNCGQSRDWKDVSVGDRKKLAILSAQAVAR
jgi:hypothetical protein